MTRIVVVGAGITGAAAAYELSRHDVTVDIVEANDRVGGLIRSSPFAGLPAVDEGADAFLLRTPSAARLAEAVGLGTPGGLLARRLMDGARWPAVPRALTDADPWISFRRKPTGVPVLGWLPVNLERVLDLADEPAGALPEGVRALASHVEERFSIPWRFVDDPSGL